jgi:hypothetical protein
VTFSDLEVAVSQCSRKHGYVRDQIALIWTPGAGKVQRAYSHELAGAMLREGDEFFDRALALYLLRGHLRQLQASTWAGVATYYANYFLALSFIRLHMRSVTQLVTGPIFNVSCETGQTPFFRIQQQGKRQRHGEVWRAYYDVVTEMAWPDASIVTDLCPTLDSLRFREQMYRERINYRPGDGFDEIYLARTRYLSGLKLILADDGRAPTVLSDAAYTDRMAALRLKHLASLLRRLGGARADSDVEASLWLRRKEIVTRYASGSSDRRFAESLTADVA